MPGPLNRHQRTWARWQQASFGRGESGGVRRGWGEGRVEDEPEQRIRCQDYTDYRQSTRSNYTCIPTDERCGQKAWF